MPSWDQVLKEIQECKRADALDFIRRKYLKELQEKRKRNVICYYFGWLQRQGVGGVEVDDNDKNAFMAAIHNLDRSKGLDLILHTPGGRVAATESIVDYLHTMFGQDIVAIIPQLAMSVGTMISCSCKEIIMGKQSNLGPIDPQFNGIQAISRSAFEHPQWPVIKQGRGLPTLFLPSLPTLHRCNTHDLNLELYSTHPS